VTGGTTLLEQLSAGGSLLVVRLGALGDVVRTLPAVRWLRDSRPSLRIAWVVEPAAAAILRDHPLLDELVVLPRPTWARAARRPWRVPAAAVDIVRFARSLRRRRFDAAIDFQGMLKSALVARAAGIPVRLGFGGEHVREGAHRFYTHRADLPDPSVSRVARALRLAEAAGATAGPVVADLGLSDADRIEGRQALDAATGAGSGPRVVVVPGTSARQSYKRYPPDRYGEVIRALATRPCRVAVAGGPGEEDLVAATVRAAGGQAGVLPPVGLRPLAAALEAADLFVGGDTGPMHVAWAVGTPVVAVFGPTRTDWNAPWGDGHRIVAPSSGPNPRHGDPFRGVPAAAVIDAARDLLDRLPRPSEEVRS
jgi:lipopolysaccharide heptosyltransferase I